MLNDMDTMRMKAVFVLTATIAFVTSPLWSAGFGGFDPQAFPVPQYDPPAQPAGYAFAIWSVIYLWLVVHAAFGLFARSESADWDATRWPLIISLVAGVPWIAVAVMNPLIATVLIWIMLIAALAALRAAPTRDHWTAAGPIGLYAGWLTAASFVALALVGAGYGFGGSALWGWIALAGAFALTTWIQSARPDVPEYGAAVAWALIAITVANWGTNTVLAIAAALGALAVAGWAATRFRGRTSA